MRNASEEGFFLINGEQKEVTQARKPMVPIVLHYDYWVYAHKTVEARSIIISETYRSKMRPPF